MTDPRFWHWTEVYVPLELQAEGYTRSFKHQKNDKYRVLLRKDGSWSYFPKPFLGLFGGYRLTDYDRLQIEKLIMELEIVSSN